MLSLKTFRAGRRVCLHSEHEEISLDLNVTIKPRETHCDYAHSVHLAITGWISATSAQLSVD